MSQTNAQVYNTVQTQTNICVYILYIYMYNKNHSKTSSGESAFRKHFIKSNCNPERHTLASQYVSWKVSSLVLSYLADLRGHPSQKWFWGQFKDWHFSHSRWRDDATTHDATATQRRRRACRLSRRHTRAQLGAPRRRHFWWEKD